MPDDVDHRVDDALEHLRHLTIDIGPRPSTRDGESRAARYVAGVMRASGLRDVRCGYFQSGRSTYQPYGMAIGAGVLGNLISLLLAPRRYTACAAALLNGLGALGFFREANLDDNWTRHLLPRHSSQNVIGIIPPLAECRKRAVLVAHLDSHRTPIFYSSPAWARVFSPLAAGVLVSLGIGSIMAGWGLGVGRSRLEWVQRLATVLEALVLVLLIHAETTPYTAGANDNASGVATVLVLGQRLAQEPLRHTEVWVVNTGCEEVGARGISALISAHGDTLREAYFLNFDMVGIGSPGLLTREGVLRSYRPDPGLLDLARKVVAQYPDLIAGEHPGGAYTDMGIVIKRGFRGLVVDSILPQRHPAKGRMGYWHQREDTYDKIERDCLAKAHRFGWEFLQRIDREAT